MPKPSRSAFYFYALEYQRRIQRTQGTRITINDAIAACYDEWKLLSEDEKQPYKILYEEWRIQYRLDPESASGYSSQQRVNQLKKAQKQEQKSEQILSQRVIPCEELKSHYDRFSYERDFLAFEYLPLDINELLNMPIYLINFQIFCKVDEEDGGQYVPAEICLLRYTLAEGATMSHQIFIKPDKIPAGYMSACLEQSKTTHEIPLKDFAEATDHYHHIYHQLKSFLIPTVLNQMKDLPEDDRTRRRYLRLTQPCVFFPAVEYEQTSRILEWLQEKVDGVKPTKETRLVNYASIESLIMLLVELKKQRVSRDEIHKTFENAAYSFMIEERCNYHTKLGISHCSVARCYALAKLLSAYLNQLYVPERTLSATKRSVSNRNHSETTSMISNSNFSTRLQAQPPMTNIRPPISSQFSTTGTSDSIASSYRPVRPVLIQSTNKDPHVTDELIHHPTIIRLQQQNFHRLLSNADTSTSSSSIVKQYAKDHDDEQSTCVSSTNSQLTKTTSDTQRAVLHQRKQALMKAIQSINKQMEELDM